MSRARKLASLLVVTLVGACSDSSGIAPTAPTANVNAMQGSGRRPPAQRWSPDDENARIAQEEIPGFGGYYWDETGELNLLLTPKGDRNQATQALTRRLSRKLFTQSERRPDPATVRVRPARYDFVQLKEWRDRAQHLFEIPGMISLDIDEVRNRIRIGVGNTIARGRIVSTLAKLQIPAEAVVMEDADPLIVRPSYMQLEEGGGSGGGSGSSNPYSLLGRVRPLRGGPIITFDKDPADASINACTLGLVVKRSGLIGFVTNSHCTRRKGGNQFTTYFQPTFNVHRIGEENYDPEWTSCQWGPRCRSSDAAFVFLTDAYAELATIVRPYTVNSGDLAYDPYSKFTVTHEWAIPMRMPEVGMRMNKVGHASGWTDGSVTHTCIDTRMDDGSGDVALCQYYYNAYAKDGDSGAPVFVLPLLSPTMSPDDPQAPRDAWLYGLHMGRFEKEGLSVFSWWAFVDSELGGVTLQ